MIDLERLFAADSIALVGVGAWAGDLPRTLRSGNVAAVFQSSGMFNLFLTLAVRRHA